MDGWWRGEAALSSLRHMVRLHAGSHNDRVHFDFSWQRAARRTRALLPELLACSCAVAWFFYLGYGRTLPPGNIRWMAQEDWAAQLWGFSFFRNADWSLPLGSIPGLFYPFGTSAAFTDSMPWLCVAFKLFSAWLPLEFQPFGLWFLACFVLQAWFGTKLARCLTHDPITIGLGGCLFALTPLLPSRHGHIALCSIFLLTAALCLHFSPVSSLRAARRSAIDATALLILAAGTHGYLTVMLLGLVLSLYLHFAMAKSWSKTEAGLQGLGACATAVIVAWLFGYIGWKAIDLTAEGFGEFSSDVAALINPLDWSRWIAPLPSQPRQSEGFAYLGLGVLALLCTALLRPSRLLPEARQALRKHAALVGVIALMFAYALSSSVQLLGQEQLDLRRFYAPFSAVTGILRGSGRFAWPLHLLMIVVAVASASRLPWLHARRGALLAAAAVQFFELNRAKLEFRPRAIDAFSDPVWSSVAQDYAHLELAPLQLKWVCAFDEPLVTRASYEAYRRKLTFNSGNFVRKPPGVQTLCGRVPDRNDAIDPRTIYIVAPAYLRAFLRPDVVCGVVDAMHVCVSRESATPLRLGLQASTAGA
jgi:hypothetical protein